MYGGYGYGGGGMMPSVLATGEQVMMMPTIPSGIDIPPGLEYLFAIASAHVQQKTDMLEIMSRIDTPNKYMIYNDQGQFIYYAQEMQSPGEFRAAQVVGDSRGFRFHVTDAMGRVVFTIFRTSKLWTNCEMIVEAPPGMPCGYALFQSSPMCRGIMTITDQFRRPILTIPFPSERDAHLSDRGYPLMMGSSLVGAIIRKWPGFQRQMMTNCDNFALTFPPDLDVRSKCVLLACAILIDFIDFEDKRDATRGKRKTISPQARASLGNPYQASFNMMGAAPYASSYMMGPEYGGGYGCSQYYPMQQLQQPMMQPMQQQYGGGYMQQPMQQLQQQPAARPVQQMQQQQQSMQQGQQYQQQPMQPVQQHQPQPQSYQQQSQQPMQPMQQQQPQSYQQQPQQSLQPMQQPMQQQQQVSQTQQQVQQLQPMLQQQQSLQQPASSSTNSAPSEPPTTARAPPMVLGHGAHPERTASKQQQKPRKKASKASKKAAQPYGQKRSKESWQRSSMGHPQQQYPQNQQQQPAASQQLQPMQPMQQQPQTRVQVAQKQKKGGLFRKISSSTQSRSKTLGEPRAVKSDHVGKKKK